jgi:hypothetical protein
MGTIIKDLPILDLRTISSEAFNKIDLVENVRTVVLSSENAEPFLRVPRVNVRSHLVVKPAETLAIGQIEFDDAYLEKLPDNSTLVVLGHIFIDGFSMPLFARKISGLRLYGQALYSDSIAAGAVLAKLERLQGQLLRMPPNARRWIGSTFLDTALLHSTRGRPVVSIGTITIDSKVTAGDITANIEAMTQIGEVAGTEEAVCALLSVCIRRLGTYTLVAAPPPPEPDISPLANQAAVLHQIRGAGGGAV